MKSIKKFEENPFEDKKIAREWINSVENERGLIRDKELYPLLKKWVKKVSPKKLVEVGSGQGICSEKLGNKKMKYIGIEPSATLIRRARNLYKGKNRKFLRGNIYKLPLRNRSADSVFSVNVWFHLKNLNKASKEMSRILALNGKFLIITGNPNSYKVWESFYYEYAKKGKKIVGRVRIPINHLSRNTFYLHKYKEIADALRENKLKIDKVEKFGAAKKYKDDGLFIAIKGHKISRREID